MDWGSILNLLVTVIVVISGGVEEEGSSGNVGRVVDGDTLEMSDGDKVRLIGVDTPEVYSEVSLGEFNASNKSCLDSYGDKASVFAEDFVDGNDVVLRSDYLSDDRGSYGRLLRYVFVGNSSLNEELVARGFARVYTDSDFSEKSRYLVLEERARENDLGVWSC